METVTHHDRTTAYRIADRGGDGDPVLFVHGSGGTHELWKAQLARLASSFPVVALDLSGHGDSEDVEADPGWSTISAYADDVLAVAEETDAKTLVGNSLGGAIVMHLVLDRDFEPDALALVGTGAKLAVLDDLLIWLESDFDRAVEFLHDGDRLFHDPEDQYIELSKESMYDVGRRVTSRDFHSCHTFDVRDQLNEIVAPTLAIVGEYDMLTPPRYHKYLADNVIDGQYVEIEGAAHLTMLETPEAFNGTLTRFLEGVR